MRSGWAAGASATSLLKRTVGTSLLFDISMEDALSLAEWESAPGAAVASTTGTKIAASADSTDSSDRRPLMWGSWWRVSLWCLRPCLCDKLCTWTGGGRRTAVLLASTAGTWGQESKCVVLPWRKILGVQHYLKLKTIFYQSREHFAVHTVVCT